jgi:hypothetical protein
MSRTSVFILPRTLNHLTRQQLSVLLIRGSRWLSVSKIYAESRTLRIRDARADFRIQWSPRIWSKYKKISVLLYGSYAESFLNKAKNRSQGAKYRKFLIEEEFHLRNAIGSIHLPKRWFYTIKNVASNALLFLSQQSHSLLIYFLDDVWSIILPPLFAVIS